MPPRFVLRELPGIAKLVARLQKIDAHPNPAWSPDKAGLQAFVDHVSRSLFGITEEETKYEHPRGGPIDGWDRAHRLHEEHFAFLWEEGPQQLMIWDLLGWDVTDGAGEMLNGLWLLERQIVMATKGLGGQLPVGLPDFDGEEGAAKWGDPLADEAARWVRERRKR